MKPSTVLDTNIFISLIIESKPGYFVTGNIKHFQHIRSLTKIMKPDEFISIIDKRKDKGI